MTLAPGAYAGITLNGTQVGWARQIIDAARSYPGTTDRDIVCALACAMQESNYYMYANDGTSSALGVTQQSAIRASLNIPHDKVGHDSASVGLFQQQPYIPGRTWGWGTIAQCMDVTYSTHAFLSPLLKIGDRANKPVTVLVQTVQKSAFPNAYAKWEALGWSLLAASTGPQPAPVSQVSKDQADLNDTGFACVADGDWGPASAAACKAFQYAAGLGVDGEMGPATREALKKVPSWHSGYYGDGGYLAEVWQQQLKNHGWHIAVNNNWDNHSRSILKQYQQEKGLEATGEGNAQSWTSLHCTVN